MAKQHKLIFHKYDPLRASCSCGWWALVHSVKEIQPRKVVKENAIRSHKKHVAYVAKIAKYRKEGKAR